MGLRRQLRGWWRLRGVDRDGMTEFRAGLYCRFVIICWMLVGFAVGMSSVGSYLFR